MVQIYAVGWKEHGSYGGVQPGDSIVNTLIYTEN